ncbi:MAG: hypothetical protein Q9217_000631 [Psora testacea]
MAYAGIASNGWKPVAALNRSDGDVSIMFLASNSVQYEVPVHDPFFSATTLSAPIPLPGGANFSYYLADYMVTVLACTDQHQYCNPVNKKCTSLTGANIVEKEVPNLDLNNIQHATELRFRYATTFLTTYSSVRSRGANALLASETLSRDILTQVGLPSNQWIIEVSNWFAVSMAKLQRLTVNYATGPDYIRSGLNLAPAVTKTDIALCKQQKIRSPNGYISFSVLGLSIILIVGSLLIFASLVLDIVIGSLREKLNWKDHKRLQWAVDEKLQLQRLAYEEAGQGQWRGGTNAVPVTAPGDAFGIPMPVDKRHPRLKKRESHDARYETTTPEARALIEGVNIGYRDNIVTVTTEYK